MSASSSSKVTLAPGPDAVAQALGWLEAIAERECWPPRPTFGLTLSLDEALTNVLSYAFAEPPSPAGRPRIELDCRQTDTHFLVELRDNGRPYDPTTKESPALAASLDEAEPGGHGLRLMHHYLDRLDYRQEQGWNVLTMAVRRDGDD